MAEPWEPRLEAIDVHLNSISENMKVLRDMSRETNERLRGVESQLHGLETRFARLSGAITAWTAIYGAMGVVALALLGWGAKEIYGFNAAIAVIKAHLGID